MSKVTNVFFARDQLRGFCGKRFSSKLQAEFQLYLYVPQDH